MRAKSFKKLFVSLALSTVLICSAATSAFAATAQLFPVEEPAVEANSDIPAVDTSSADAASASSLTSQAGISQTAASANSITVQWNPVANAAKYALNVSYFNSSSYKFLGYLENTRSKVTINKLKSGTAYKVRITAISSSGTAISSRTAGCTTLYTSITVKSSYMSSSGYTFNMSPANPSNSITGYKVVYQSSAAHKLMTKYFNTKYPSFTLPVSGSTFYQIKIYPYLVLNNKRYVSTVPTTRYIARPIILQKAGVSRNSMSVKWNKVSGASSYTIYIKYPNSSSYKKIRTTTATSFTLTNMSRNTRYGIRVVANKKVNNKTWTSAPNNYAMSIS